MTRMIGVFVTFTFTDHFDAAKLRAIAHEARGKFDGHLGLRSKAFTLSEAERRATNFYIWDDEGTARAFFAPAMVERVARLYGATPTISFVEIAELVDNAH